MLSPSEIEQRLPVWHALSELFLDTELQPEDYGAMADILCRSAYSAAQIRNILEEEVTPAFGSNLLAVAGEWSGWNEAEVREIMLRSLRRRGRLRLGARLMTRLHRTYLHTEWSKIEPLLTKL